MSFALLSAQAGAVELDFGVSVASLASSLSAAAAAVVVTAYFLSFLKDHTKDQKAIIDQFRGYHAESQRKFQDQVDRLADRQTESLATFRAHVSRVSDAQNAMLKDAIQTIKSIERTLAGSTSTVHGVEGAIDSLKEAIRAIDVVISRPSGE